MLALCYDKTVTLRSDYPAPAPEAGEVLLAVRLAGVCKTDLEIVKGYMGFAGVMGHECVATVARGPADWLGRRVAVEINCPCGRCDLCRRGLGNHCPMRGVLGIAKRDGVFAELVAVPEANLHAIPDSVSDDAAVFVEPLAAAMQIFEQVHIDAGQRCVILGDGRLGQLTARAFRSRGLDALLVGKHETKLALARGAGVRTAQVAQAFQPVGHSLERLCHEFSPAADADVVVDATGSAAGFDLAMRAVRPRGVIVLKSTFAAEGGMNLAPLVINEVTVVGSRCGPFDKAIAALAEGSVRVEDLISARLPLSRAAEALALAARPDMMKVLIDVDSR
ncbi:MAG: alcohol dehydrogenase catalytic domain-containing protein [Planctomycetaceae bacterium]|nr:alcohol dehydrogenase catalytic domain-containing protein [Planctomycetaceae bacterium]